MQITHLSPPTDSRPSTLDYIESYPPLLLFPPLLPPFPLSFPSCSSPPPSPPPPPFSSSPPPLFFQVALLTEELSCVRSEGGERVRVLEGRVREQAERLATYEQMEKEMDDIIMQAAQGMWITSSLHHHYIIIITSSSHHHYIITTSSSHHHHIIITSSDHHHHYYV